MSKMQDFSYSVSSVLVSETDLKKAGEPRVTGPVWDVFRTHRELGFEFQLSRHLYLVEVGEETVWVKSSNKLEEGLRGETRNGRAFTILRRIDQEDLIIDLSNPDPVLIEAVGEFMCGTTLHGQWLADMVMHLSQLYVRTR